MKFVTGLLAFCVATQAMRLDISNPILEYQTGTRVTYQYRTHSSIGVPSLANDRSGFGLWTTVHLDFEPHDQVVMTLETPEVRTLELESFRQRVDDNRCPPLDEVRDVTAKLRPEIEEILLTQLVKPVSFVFARDSGRISDIRATEDEPEWCLNMKRAIINQFQLQTINGIEHKLEDTIIGKQCRVHYDVLRPESTELNSYLITKEYRPEHCEVVSDFFDVIGMIPEKVNNEPEMIRSNFIHKHEVVEMNRRYVIKSVVSEGRIVTSGMEPTEGEIVHFTRQEMHFVEEKEMMNMNRMYSQLVKRSETLFVPLTSKVNPMVDIYSEVIPEPIKIEHIKMLITEIVEKIMSEDKPTMEFQQTHEFFTLIRHLRSIVKVESIEELIRFVKTTPTKNVKYMTSVLETALRFCGSPAIIEALPVLKTHLTPYEFNMLVTALPFTHYPTNPTVLRTLKHLYTSTPVDEEYTRRQTMLAFGSMLHNLCRMTEDEVLIKLCKDEIEPEANMFLVGEYQKGDETMKLVVLKTIGNSGLHMPEFLEQQITNTQLTENLRVNAIYALRRCTYDNKVREILLPIYRNWELCPELRIAAFDVLMDKFPTAEMLNVLVARMPEESNRQVGNYVYSFVRNVLDLPTTFKPTKNLTIACQEHIGYLRRFEDGIFFSKNLNMFFKSITMRLSDLINLDQVFVREQAFPRSLRLRDIKVFCQYYLEILDVTMRFQDMDGIYRDLLKNVFANMKDNTEILDKVIGEAWRNDILSIIDLFTAEPEFKDEEPRMHIFLRSMRQEFGLVTLEELRTTREDLQERLINWITDDRTLSSLVTFPLGVYTYKTQSLIGIPLLNEMNLMFVANFETYPTKDNEFDQHINTRFMLTAGFHTGLDLGVMKHGIVANMGINHVMPLKLRIEYNENTHEVDYEAVIDVTHPLARNTGLKVWSRWMHITETIVVKQNKPLPMTHFRDLITNALIPTEHYETVFLGMRYNLVWYPKTPSVKLPSCVNFLWGLEKFEIHFVDFKPIPLGLRLRINTDEPTLKLKVNVHMNPRVPTLKRDLEITTGLLKNDKPIFWVEVAPKWVKDVYRLYAEYKVQGKINTRFSWLEAAEVKPLEVLFKLQCGWNKVFDARNNDFLTKIFIGKTDLQKTFELEDSRIESSDCYKCELTKNTQFWRNVHCDRCIFKRTSLTLTDAKVFISKDLFETVNKYYTPLINYLTIPYMSLFETRYLDPEIQIMDTLIEDEHNILSNYMNRLLSNDKIVAFRNKMEFHPLLTELNSTIEIMDLKLKYNHLPLFATNRRVDNLPVNRLTDVVTDRFIMNHFGQCSIDSKKVETFDNVAYEVNTLTENPECEKLLVKDCTEEGKRFEITTKTLKDAKKTLKIKTEKDLIEILPLTNGKYEIKINNVVKPFTNERVENEIVLATRVPVTTPRKTVEYKLVLIVKETNTYITMIHDFVDVQLPMYYRNRVCGLCGDYTAEYVYEFKLTDRTVAPSLERFLQEYTTKTCQPTMNMRYRY